MSFDFQTVTDSLPTWPQSKFSANVLFAGKLSSQMPYEKLLLHQKWPIFRRIVAIPLVRCR